MQGGKWEARLGQSKTSKHSYLGLFDSEEDAAKAYDTATINRFGHGMPVNFDLGQVSCCLAWLLCNFEGTASTQASQSKVSIPAPLTTPADHNSKL